jgi:hypothetical protein
MPPCDNHFLISYEHLQYGHGECRPIYQQPLGRIQLLAEDCSHFALLLTSSPPIYILHKLCRGARSLNTVCAYEQKYHEYV